MNQRIHTLVAAITAVSSFALAQDTKETTAKAAPAEATKPADAPAPPAPPPAPTFDPSKNPLESVDMKKVSYFIGSNFGRQMGSQGIKPDYDAFKEGMQTAVEQKEPKFKEDELRGEMEKFGAAMQEMDKRKRSEQGKKGEEFLVTNAKKEGVKTTASGLQYEVMKAGEGAKPAATDTVKVHYKGTLISGEEFDSSYSRNEPATFPLNGVIAGWTEGVQLMNKGSKFKFVIPGKLAYGEAGSPPKIGPNETLVFEVELLEIVGK
jgi:FKBP-type peptidyl-prolyl cis-trans isomerase